MSKKESKKARKKRLKEEEIRNKTKATKPNNPKRKVGSKKIAWSHYVPLLIIIIFSFACFYPSLENGYVNWDDDKNFFENPHITELNSENFWINTKKIFTTPVIGNYNPLPIFTFAIEQQVFGLDQPIYWHLDNILLHLICVLFVFLIGRQLGLNYWGNILFTLLFAIHPLRVESVTWITERKDVLFGMFYLIAIYYYIKSITDRPKMKYWFIIWTCFILSLFSKIQAVILPVSFVLIDYYFSGKLEIKAILKKAPFFLGSVLFGLLGIYFLKDQGSLNMADTYAGYQRVFIGSWSLFIYYIKSIVPYPLSPLYPYPTSIPWYFYVSFLSFVLTGFYLWKAYFNQWKVGFFGVGFFLANIFFLLQILGAGQGFTADRFSYIAFIGLNFIYAYYFEKLLQYKVKLKPAILGLAGILILAFGFMTYQQTKIWKDSETLWTHVLKHYNKIDLPYGNRANFRRDKSQDLARAAQVARSKNNRTEFERLSRESDRYVQLALADYSQTIRLKPNEPRPYNSRARLYFNYNSRDSLLKALDNYNKAIELKPDEDEYWINRGATYAKLGDFQNALVNLNKGIEINPNFQNGYLNRSVILDQQGDYEGALRDIESYLKLKPYNGDMWYECSRLRLQLGKFQSAFDAIQNAIRNGGNKGVYYFQLSRCYYELKDFTNAKNMMNQSIKLGYKGDQSITNTILGS